MLRSTRLLLVFLPPLVTCRQAVDLHEINRQLGAARRQLSRQRVKMRLDCFTAALMKLIVGVFILSGHDMTTAVAVARQLRRSDEDMMQDRERSWADVVSEWYLQISEAQELVWHFPVSNTEINMQQTALEWVAQYRVTQWVKTQNKDHGVAPASMEMFEKFVDICRSLGIKRVPLLETMLHSAGRSARQWSLRFRRRWSIRLGRLKVREPCTPSEIRLKVPHDLLNTKVILPGLRL